MPFRYSKSHVMTALVFISSIVPVCCAYADKSNSQVHITANELPAPYATASADNGPQVVAQPAGAKLVLPPGFHAEVFAEGLENPRWLAFAPNGDLFCVESQPNRIRVLRDTKHTGIADIKEIFAEGLNLPFGIAFNKNHLYVSNTDSIVRFSYTPGQLKSVTAPETIVAGIPGHGYHQHWTRDLVFNPSGSKMYLSVGSAKDIDETEEEKRAAILEFNPDGSSMRVFASGLRNASGKAFNPMTGQLWTTCNERDGLGDEVPPDFFSSVKEGGFYGWPYYYIGGHHDPRVSEKSKPAAPGIVPEVLITPHSASLGLVFYAGTQFPVEYRGDAFIALHGSGNRVKRTGYKIVRVHFKHGQPVGGYEDFLSGWMLGEDDKRVWGRPAGLAVGKDGSLYVADDGAGKIWRISYTKP